MTSIEKIIGNWGHFQCGIYCIVAIIAFMTGLAVMELDFIAGVPSARCELPGIDGPLFEKSIDLSKSTNGSTRSFHGALVNETNLSLFYSKPFVQRGKVMYCSYCDNEIEPQTQLTNMSKLWTYNDTTKKNATPVVNPVGCAAKDAIECSPGHYIYDQSQFATTMSADFDMVCKQGAWKRQLASSCTMVGMFMGSVMGGLMSDKYGRRPTILISGFAFFLGNCLTFTVNHFIFLCILQVFNIAMVFASTVTCYILIMELSGGLPQTTAGILYQAIFTVGYMMMGLLAYFIRSWKMLHLACALPSLLIGICWLLPESPRWLLVNNRSEEARRVIGKICRRNGLREPDQKVVEGLMASSNPETDSSATFLSLFRNGKLALITCGNAYCWFVCSTLYFGISKNVADLPGDFYVNYQLSGLCEIPGMFIAIPMMTKLGRRTTLVIFFAFGGFATVLCPFLAPHVPTLAVTLAIIGKMVAAASFAVAYNYSAELFPTFLRSTAIGFASAMARIGSILAPQISLLGTILQLPWFSFVMFGAFAAIGSVLVMLLPETKGKQLPDTLDDMIKLYKSPKDIELSFSPSRQPLNSHVFDETIPTLGEHNI